MICSPLASAPWPGALTGVMLPKLALHPLQHLPPEALGAQAPASPQRLERLWNRLLQPPPLHPLFELRPARRRVLLDRLMHGPRILNAGALRGMAA